MRDLFYIKYIIIYSVLIVMSGCFHEKKYNLNNEPAYRHVIGLEYVLREDVFLVVFEKGGGVKNVEVFAMPTGRAGLPKVVAHESLGKDFELGVIVGYLRTGSTMTVKNIKSVHSFDDMYLAFEVVVESSDWSSSRIVTVRHLLDPDVVKPRIAEKYAYIRGESKD